MKNVREREKNVMRERKGRAIDGSIEEWLNEWVSVWSTFEFGNVVGVYHR